MRVVVPSLREEEEVARVRLEDDGVRVRVETVGDVGSSADVQRGEVPERQVAHQPRVAEHASARPGKCTRQPLPPRYVKTSSRGDDADARASRPSAEARATRGEGRRDARARGGRTRRGDAVARAKDADDIPASRRRARARKWSRRFAATSLSGGVTAHPISQQSSISPRRPLSLYMDGRALPLFHLKPLLGVRSLRRLREDTRVVHPNLSRVLGLRVGLVGGSPRRARFGGARR